VEETQNLDMKVALLQINFIEVLHRHECHIHRHVAGRRADRAGAVRTVAPPSEPGKAFGRCPALMRLYWFCDGTRIRQLAVHDAISKSTVTNIRMRASLCSPPAPRVCRGPC
jgi:hypothetical protein